MAKLGIFTGTSANDTTGDTLSQGAVKINSNFSEIYSAIGDGTNITNSLSSITVAGLSTFTNGPVVIGSGIQTGTSKLQVSGDTFITGSVGIGTSTTTNNRLTVDDYFNKNTLTSNPQFVGETLISNPYKFKQDYQDIKLSRMTYGKKDFALDATYIQSQDEASSLMKWMIEKTTKPFYHMGGDVGVSSLLKPTDALGDSIAELSDVDVIPLSYILEKIDWNRFEYIELVKIDTQGKDLDIIKSSGKYLDKIVYLNCEINTFNHYENNIAPSEYHTYLESMGFEKVLDNSIVDGEVVDVTYINKKYIHLKDKINYFVL